MSILVQTVTRCPVCGAEAFSYTEFLYETPYFGNVVVSTGFCRSCGYRFFDVDYAESGNPTRVIFKAENGEDVSKSLVVRSKTGSIKSPDLGFSLEPGPHAEPFVTTVEGLLYRALDYAESLKALEPESARRVDEFIEAVQRAIDSGGFTLIVEDPLGKSVIIPRRPETVKIEPLGST
ncbi:MAG: ZPR1 zinc finger domain-containing protein [Thermoproteus sp.]|jgi:zinc finger protein|nr:ZPR1 zinc finger domain-containing protein [Thermoproteus sp.]